MSLNNERAKFEEFKLENSKDLEVERNTKAKYEELVLKLKEDLMRKDVEINKNLLKFVNRFSDLLFILACYENR